MRAQLNRRNVVLGALLAATLAVSAWTLMNGPDSTVVEPTARAPGAAGSSPRGTVGASKSAATNTAPNGSSDASPNASPGASTSPAAARRGSGAAIPPGDGGELSLAPRPAAPTAITNLFGLYTYQAPAPVAAAPVAARTHAPPLPFTYTGHLEIDGHNTYLFLQGDAPISATVGTVIGEFTLVEATGSTLMFLHGPSGDRVPLSIAAVGG